MPEELSPESKLFVKEEIEKIRKDIREEVEEVKSKTTKTFTTVAIVVGLITGLGVYGIAKSYINTAVEAQLDADTVAEIENYRGEAKKLYNKIAEYETDANDILSSLSSHMVIGTIVPYGGKIEDSEEPIEVREGWFFCNGALLKRSDYPLLYDVIKDAFGAPNRDTFNLPDLRGRVAVGAGSGKGLATRELGKTGGEEKHILTIDEMPKHKHRWKDVRADRKDDYGFGGSESNVHRILPSKGDKPGMHFIDDISQDQGKDKPHNNMQPFLVVNYIIKAR